MKHWRKPSGSYRDPRERNSKGGNRKDKVPRLRGRNMSDILKNNKETKVAGVQ